MAHPGHDSSAVDGPAVDGSAVDGDRLLARLAALAQVSEDGPGVTRLAYSEKDVAAREMEARWMAAAGLQVSVDPAANLVGRLPGPGPAGPRGPRGQSPGPAGPGGQSPGPAGPGGQSQGHCPRWLATGSH